MLYAGVTAYLDLGLDADTIFNARQKRQQGVLPGADTPQARCSSELDVGEPTAALVAETVDEARSALDKLALRYPDVIKLIFDWARGATGPELSPKVRGRDRLNTLLVRAVVPESGIAADAR
jgi:hypothetical protein